MFSSVKRVPSSQSIVESSVLWGVIGVWSIVCIVFVAFGRCADRAALVKFDRHAAARPELLFCGDQLTGFDADRTARQKEQRDDALCRRCNKRSKICSLQMQERVGVFVMNLSLAGCLCRSRPKSRRTSPGRGRSPPTIRSLAFLPDPYAAALHANFLQLLVEKPASSDVADADIPSSDGGIVRESSRAVDAASFTAADDDITRMARTSSIPLRLWRGRRLIAHLWLIRVCGARVVGLRKDWPPSPVFPRRSLHGTLFLDRL